MRGFATAFYQTGVQGASPYRWSHAAPLPRRDSLIQAVEPQGGADLLPGSDVLETYDSTLTMT
jgi:hypothetical protein